ncbi:MAG TPA: trypsin-like peptidase domain-containing protein, partial [Mycobacterium sp.]|nr:trypsin-like peptidase domain-containing protein [Mycobacterium sp.]
MRLRFWLRLLATVAVLGLLVPAASAAEAGAAPLDPAAVIAQVEPGLVQITTEVDFQGLVGNGTGIVLSPDGQVLTNHHVVQGANTIKVRSMADGRTYLADLVGYDRNSDIAVIQMRGAAGLPVAPLGDSNTLALGDPVLTVGNANGTGNPLTHEKGAVTSLSRVIDAHDEMTGSSNNLGGLIESSTNLRSGDSGGALINSAGQVVGLNAAATLNYKVDGESTPGGQGFAIPIDRAVGIANQIRNGTATPAVHIGGSAMLGVGISSAKRPPSGGLPVRTVLRNGPADQAGIRPGDILMTIDGIPIDSANALTGLLDQRYPGD